MWEKIDVYPYRRAGDKKSRYYRVFKEKIGTKSGDRNKTAFKARTRGKSGFSSESVGQVFSLSGFFLCLAGFFMGRAVLLGELAPFGMAFVGASSRLMGGSGLGVTLAVLLGLYSIGSSIHFSSSAAVVAAIWLLSRTALRRTKKQWLVVPGLVLVVTLVVKTSFAAFVNPSLYDYISVAFEAVFAGVLAFIFLNALAPFSGERRTRPLSGEEIFCLIVAFAGIIAGSGGISYNLLTLHGVITKTFILLAALVGGGGMGAAAGAIMGIIPGISSATSPALIGAYSFSGLLAGIFKGFGKIGVIMGFLLGNIILSLYTTTYGELASILAETGVAILLVLVIPGRLVETIRVFFRSQIPNIRGIPPRDAQFKEIVKSRFREWSRMFRELSRTFERISATSELPAKDRSIQSLFNEVAAKVCEGCAFYKTCWEREFYKTYQDILDMFSTVETYGKISEKDLPEALRHRCGRTREMAVTINCLYDTFKVNRYWSERLMESRDLVSEQLKGISHIMDNLSNELDLEMGQAKDVDKELLDKLRKFNVPVIDLYTIKQEGSDRFEINIIMPACSEESEEMECQQKVAPLVSKITGQHFSVAGSCSRKEGEETCTFRLYPSLAHRVLVGVARMGKGGSNISGDSYSCLELNEGRFAVMLSDGMGAGPKAALESSTTVSLLEYLLESGFGQNLAVKTVNSVLSLRSSDENFATVDLSILNLYTGNVDMVKIGAATSFLVRGRKVRMITSDSLPVGILKEIEVRTIKKTLKSGDVLIMVTDGALDVHKGEEKEEWFINMLRETVSLDPERPEDPQELAEYLLEEVKAEAGGSAGVPDDVTIIVLKLEKLKHSLN